MNTQTIISLLIAERDRLTRAIDALGAPKRRGRPPKNPALTPLAVVENKRRRPRTEAQKRAQSIRMKNYWRKRHAAAA